MAFATRESPLTMFDIRNAFARRFIRDTFAVATGDYFAYGVMFVLTVLVSRTFGASELGRFSLGFAISSILILSTNNGFSAILKRDVAVKRSRAPEYTGTFWALRILMLAVLGLFVVVGTALAAHRDQRTALVVAIVYFAKSIDSLGEICFGVYQACDRMMFYSIARIAQFGTLLAGCSVALFYFRSVNLFYWVFVAVSTVSLLANVSFIWNGMGIVPRFSRQLLSYSFRESWPLIVNAFAYVAYARIGILIVGYLLGVEATGIYSAGVNVLSGLAVLPAACGVVLFPRMSRAFENNDPRLLVTIRKTMLLLAAVGALVTCILVFGAPWVIRLYGKLPLNAVGMTRLLALGLTPQFAAPVLGYAFTAIRRQKDGMLFATGMLAVSAILYFLFTSIAGRNGAALAYVTSQLLWTLGAYFLINRRLTTASPSLAGATC